MKSSCIALVLGMGLAVQTAFADASYQETTQVTGGSMVNTVKQVSFLSSSMKKLTDPTVTMVMVQGNKLARVSADSTEIIDLDRKTTTHIDTQKKTYFVTTFEQVAQTVQKVQQQVQEKQPAQPEMPQGSSDVKLSYSFDVKNTGATQEIEGNMAHQALITSKLNATSATQPGQLTMEVTNEVWLLDEPPAAYKEVQDFYRRMGMLMMAGGMFNPSQANAMLASHPGAADSMAGLQEQMKKLKGFSVLEISRMGETADGMPLPPPSTPPAAPAQAQANQTSGSSATQQVATDTATDTASQESSKLGIFGSSLGHSAIRAFGHKKQQDQQTQQQNSAQTSAADPVLMETTTKKSNFSTAPVPASAFEIPAGYKQINVGQ